MTAPVTIDLDDTILSALDGFASTMARSRDGIIILALQEWLAAQSDFIAHVKAGIADAEAGRFVSQEEMERIAGKYGAV